MLRRAGWAGWSWALMGAPAHPPSCSATPSPQRCSCRAGLPQQSCWPASGTSHASACAAPSPAHHGMGEPMVCAGTSLAHSLDVLLSGSNQTVTQSTTPVNRNLLQQWHTIRNRIQLWHQGAFMATENKLHLGRTDKDLRKTCHIVRMATSYCILMAGFAPGWCSNPWLHD